MTGSAEDTILSLVVVTQKFVPQEEMTDPKKTIVIANPVFQVKQSPKRNAKWLDCHLLRTSQSQ